MKRNAGLTIVEMAVVSAIICVLIAILLPALGLARQASRTVACGNNIRQLALATFQYADRHADMMPSAYHNTFARLAPYLGGGVWQCGSDVFAGDADSCSYAPNADRTGFTVGEGVLAPDEWAGWAGGQFSPWTVCTKDQPPGYQVIGRLSQAADDTLLLGESWRDRDNYRALDVLGWPMFGRYMNTVRPRDSLMLRAYTATDTPYAFLLETQQYHDGRMNAAFADGHVAGTQIKRLTEGPRTAPWTKQAD